MLFFFVFGSRFFASASRCFCLCVTMFLPLRQDVFAFALQLFTFTSGCFCLYVKMFLPLVTTFYLCVTMFLTLRHDVFDFTSRCFCLCVTTFYLYFTNKRNFLFTVNVVLFANEKYYEHLSLCSATSIVALQIFILALRTEMIFYLL